VVWDYHVVLLVRSRDQQHWIYDFDTRLPFPCLMQGSNSPNVLSNHSHPKTTCPIHFERMYEARTKGFCSSSTWSNSVTGTTSSLFRIVPGPIFVEHFASDRSHMVNSTLVCTLCVVNVVRLKLTDASDSNSGSEASSIQTYRSPPPSHSPIRGKNARVANNLMRSFVCMIPSDETFGYVNDLRAMIEMAET
jgi:hypothetical protein